MAAMKNPDGQEQVLEAAARDLERLRSLSLDDLKAMKVRFGTVHKGQTFEEVWNRDQMWFRQMVGRFFSSCKWEHMTLVRFAKLKEEYDLRQKFHADVESGTTAVIVQQQMEIYSLKEHVSYLEAILKKVVESVALAQPEVHGNLPSVWQFDASDGSETQ